MNKYVIDYEYGVADFYTDASNPDDVRLEFHTAANRCFGIRKSLGGYRVLESYQNVELPIPYRDKGGTHFLSHHGDEILFKYLGLPGDLDKSWWKLHSEHGDWCSCKIEGVQELACSVHHFWVPDHNLVCDCMTKR